LPQSTKGFESLDIAALRHIGLETEGAAALGGNVLDDGVDPVLTPRSQYDFRSVSRKKLCSAFSKTATGSGDYYNFVRNI
jgi:hypothetical protein